MANSKEPKIIEGGIFKDERGKLTFVNGFGFENIKRFYMVENAEVGMVRAFHGHLIEEKYVLTVSGSALVAAVKIDDPVSPDKKNEVYRFTLGAEKPVILHIPAGYANGFKSLESATKVIFFSTASLEDSKKDDYRFPADYWGEKTWGI